MSEDGGAAMDDEDYVEEEGDVEEKDDPEDLLEDEEITAEEEAFLKGYDEDSESGEAKSEPTEKEKE